MGKNCGIFLVVDLANAGAQPFGYAIDYKFGFDFGFWAKLI